MILIFINILRENSALYGCNNRCIEINNGKGVTEYYIRGKMKSSTNNSIFKFRPVIDPNKEIILDIKDIKESNIIKDCIKPFRPRSGINKAFYIQGRHFHNFNTNLIENQEFWQTDAAGNFIYE